MQTPVAIIKIYIPYQNILSSIDFLTPCFKKKCPASHLSSFCYKCCHNFFLEGIFSVRCDCACWHWSDRLSVMLVPNKHCMPLGLCRGGCHSHKCPITGNLKSKSNITATYEQDRPLFEAHDISFKAQFQVAELQ